MKRLTIVAVIALFPVVLAAQTQHLRFTNDGAFASIAADTDPLSNFTLQVSRGAAGSVASTSLTYTAFSFSSDFNFLTFTQIIGAIPDSSFTGVNTQNLALDLDTSALDPTTAFSQTCTIDLSTLTVDCAAIPAGQIHLAFHSNGFQQTRLLAQEQFNTFGPVTIHSHQRADSGSANVQGTIFGVTFSSSSATVGTNHMSTIEFTRN